MKRFRLFTMACALAAMSCGPPSKAQSDTRSVAEQYLFQAANAERAQRGLPALQWDEALHRAAINHAIEMARRRSISHQYPGEAELSERGQQAGAHFSVIAENVAEAPTAVRIHDAWMKSEHHRENLLDPRLTSIAISVILRDGELYAVQDFERSVAALSYTEQENAVAALLTAAAPVQLVDDNADARRSCELDTGYAGSRRPYFVMRFTSGDLDRLPDALRQRLATGKYRQAAVGACALHERQPFSAYSIAVLLYL